MYTRLNKIYRLWSKKRGQEKLRKKEGKVNIKIVYVNLPLLFLRFC